MYKEYWGLDRSPFENTNDTFFCYYSPCHKEALARMQYAVAQQKLGVVLSGDYGVGKTFLSRVLMKEFFDGQCVYVYIPNPRLTPLELLREIDYQLGADLDFPLPPNKTELLRRFKERLEQLHKEKLYVVVIIDEAQSIKDNDLLEEIRLLLNVHQEETTLFTLILSGQTELVQKVKAMPSLRQRLAISYELLPLDQNETIKYIEHRLQVTGADHKIFTDTAYEEIYNASGGLPRVINNICDLSLLTGFLRKVKVIDREIVTHSAEELGEGGGGSSLGGEGHG